MYFGYICLLSFKTFLHLISFFVILLFTTKRVSAVDNILHSGNVISIPALSDCPLETGFHYNSVYCKSMADNLASETDEDEDNKSAVESVLRDDKNYDQHIKQISLNSSQTQFVFLTVYHPPD